MASAGQVDGSTVVRREEIVDKTKPFSIPKALVMKAYRLVKANRGAAGVDRQSLEDFEAHGKDNLYKLWNRLVSGSYFPPPVRSVSIPKKQGGERILGVPTVADRIGQMVVKLLWEPAVERHFLPDSYGYRPRKSALEAVGITRRRCWKYDWVLEFDICGLFDNIPHDLLMKAVRYHTKEKWIVMYIERWLKAPMQAPDGTLQERTKGTPQGGVLSPVLANLFLHYAFDAWMQRKHSQVPWCRYADDGLLHCQTEGQAKNLKGELRERFAECGLQLHPEKTKIVYCKDGTRRKEYPEVQFDFLGYAFRPRIVKNRKDGNIFASYTPAVSKTAQKAMCALIRGSGVRNQTERSLVDISRQWDPILRGWLQYYGKFCPTAMDPVLRHFNRTLVKWAMGKYKRLKGHKTQASLYIQAISKHQRDLFVHWQSGNVSVVG